jgi:hypothetical protein
MLLIETLKSLMQADKEYIEGDLIVNNNKTYKTILICHIAIFRIKELKKKTTVEISTRYAHLLKITSAIINHKNTWIQLEPEYLLERIKDCFTELYQRCIKDSIKDPFGCCHRFIECSDKRRCIHNDKLFARGCMYRENLNKGLIFYGKNKNFPPASKNNQDISKKMTS